MIWLLFKVVSRVVIAWLIISILLLNAWDYGYKQGYEDAMSEVLLGITKPMDFFKEKYNIGK